jgi:hypothetical protein
MRHTGDPKGTKWCGKCGGYFCRPAPRLATETTKENDYDRGTNEDEVRQMTRWEVEDYVHGMPE